MNSREYRGHSSSSYNIRISIPVQPDQDLDYQTVGPIAILRTLLYATLIFLPVVLMFFFKCLLL